MSTLRFQALNETFKRETVAIDESVRRSELFGQNVFNEKTMKQYLTKDAFKSVMSAIENGTKIDRGIADQIASAMKDWALSKGATHYTHWFQPLTGATAEKHDAFF
jgi:glutamine synthetase